MIIAVQQVYFRERKRSFADLSVADEFVLPTKGAVEMFGQDLAKNSSKYRTSQTVLAPR